MSSSHKILRLGRVREITGIGRSSLYKAMKNGEFPASVSLGPRAVGWLESDIQAWLDGRIKLSKTPSPILRGGRNG
ncbi:helix-turn-helix transcriptional regulator [Collimonas silvisoli]|uniref:helix-turn-helix transcriptional regulator n=1 Tax=Collimonas silvisoli TaxID=2825884 RepID=UPI001B8AB433|nr:AlpA family transcriptional regulator [Collimonas silvisoli]